MDLNIINTLKSLQTSCGYNFDMIREEIKTHIPEDYSTTVDAATKTLYVYVPSMNQMYSIARVGNHFPNFENMLLYGKEVPTTAKTGNICLLFFGSDDANRFITENKSLPADIEYVKVPKKKLGYIRRYYTNYQEIEYTFYHYITNYVNSNDVNLIGDALKSWLIDSGRFRYFNPEGLSENVFGGEIKCKLKFVLFETRTSEGASYNPEIIMSGGNEPLMSIEIKNIVYQNLNNEELLRVKVILDIMEMPSKYFEFMKVVKNSIETTLISTQNTKKQLKEHFTRINEDYS